MLDTVNENCTTDTSVAPVTAEGEYQNMLKIPVARLGSWYHPAYGIVSFTQKDFNEMIQNFSSNELGFPPYMRYGHDIGAQGEGIVDADPSRGLITSLVQDGEVLFSLVVASDVNAVADVREKRYRFASAELLRNVDSKNTGEKIGTVLKAISLTNAPFLPNLPQCEALSESSDPLTTPGFFVLNLAQPTVIEPVVETVEHEAEEMSLLARLEKKVTAMYDKLTGFLDKDQVEETASQFSQPGDIVTLETVADQEEQIVQEDHALSGSVISEEQETTQMSEENKTEEQQEEPKVAPAAAQDESLSQNVAKLMEEMVAMKATLDATVAEKDALKHELSSAKATLDETSKAAELFSNALATEKLDKLKNALVAEGIPPTMVEQAFSLAASIPVKELKLSDGASVSISEKMAEVLRTLPADNRVKFGQVGHNLSTSSAPTTSPFADIIDRYKGDIGKSGK